MVNIIYTNHFYTNFSKSLKYKRNIVSKRITYSMDTMIHLKFNDFLLDIFLKDTTNVRNHNRFKFSSIVRLFVLFSVFQIIYEFSKIW